MRFEVEDRSSSSYARYCVFDRHAQIRTSWKYKARLPQIGRWAASFPNREDARAWAQGANEREEIRLSNEARAARLAAMPAARDALHEVIERSTDAAIEILRNYGATHLMYIDSADQLTAFTTDCNSWVRAFERKKELENRVRGAELKALYAAADAKWRSKQDASVWLCAPAEPLKITRVMMLSDLYTFDTLPDNVPKAWLYPCEVHVPQPPFAPSGRYGQ
jgi:hypothetical protein